MPQARPGLDTKLSLVVKAGIGGFHPPRKQLTGKIIVPELVCTRRAGENLEDLIYRNVEGTDLAIIYRVKQQVANIVGSIKVSKQMMETWGVDENRIHEFAFHNMNQLSTLQIVELNSDFAMPEETFSELPEKMNKYSSYELVAEFENDLRCRNPGRYKMAGKVLEDELEMGISFDTKVLEQLADKLFALRDLIPEQGRIAYQLLPQDCKEMTDQLVEFLLSEVPEIRKCFDCYVDAKYKLSELYATDNKWLKSQKEKYGKEAKKILANRILSGVKTICRLEKEEKGAAYLAKHREYLASRIIMEAMDMLAQAASEQEEAFNRQQNIAGELSKEAKKELFIKNQDKGYEH